MLALEIVNIFPHQPESILYRNVHNDLFKHEGKDGAYFRQ